MQKFLLYLAFVCFLYSSEALAELAGPQQARQVCRNWLTFMVDLEGDWADSASPQITAVDEVSFNKTLLGYCFQIEPSGYVLVPTLMELAPIKASSQNSSFDPESEGGFSLLVRENLYDRFHRFSSQDGSLSAVQSSRNQQAWKKFLLDDNEFRLGLGSLNSEENSSAGPLLSTAWHQGPPYNDFCPMGDEGQLCVVGCVATAIAQVMAYHGSPGAGNDRHQYYWYGDGTCGGVPRPGILSADFNDSYEFDLMPDHCTVDDPQRIKDAVAELCYEVAVSVDMNFGVCWSGSNTANAQTILPEYFRYHDLIQLADRSDFIPRSWFNLIKTEIDREQPVLYSFALAAGGGHAVVCDGWRTEAGIDQIHLNYGWAGSHTAWYALDDIYNSVDPDAEKLVYNIVPGPGEPSGVDGGNLAKQELMISSYPNPFNPQTQISFELSTSEQVRVSVFDMNGRRIAKIAERTFGEGPQTLDWNGRDNAGRLVPSGTYLLRIDAGQETWHGKMMLVR